MLLYKMLYIVLAYLMLFAALTNSVCLNNASFLCQGYELSGEIALKNNHYYYYYYYSISFAHDCHLHFSLLPNLHPYMLLHHLGFFHTYLKEYL